ncbi:Trp biosynthesis-associated membrane protein [Cellulomonas marina]|uniref:Trp region conserved hypothetical membrane protein n=1 Tax=Cellulomonas marina TaxID=988821 RepID=A0A1I0ZSK5_9CELL|nr:Trp biosynthesis-associated membrane protein [Cellulomonas marina]GIG28867.1 hypothetical protein Cma02nite_14670 [Cellulomonas marina]SFB27410.1 trp region conserved hypothetical membrane protein [Cellulomonas marina]
MTSRGRTSVGVLALAAAAGLVSLAGWVRSTVTTPVDGTVTLSVTGAVAAPAVPAVALVLAACALALLLVGRVGRWLVAVVLVLAGGVLAVVSDGVRRGAQAVAEDAARARTGVDVLAGPVTVSPMVEVAVVVGVLAALSGLAVVRSGRSWSAPSRRHERTQGQPGAVADGLTLGGASGPARDRAAGTTSHRAVRGTPAGTQAGDPPTPGSAGPGAGGDASRPVDWDALSRGEDPS